MTSTSSRIGNSTQTFTFIPAVNPRRFVRFRVSQSQRLIWHNKWKPLTTSERATCDVDPSTSSSHRLIVARVLAAITGMRFHPQ